MTTNLLLSLQITALGMGLVFGAIILLWLMMVILAALTAEKESVDETAASNSAGLSVPTQADSKLQAALLAVAIAMADQESSSAHPLPIPPTAIVSAWQLGMRTSQRSEKGNFRRH